MVIGYCRVKLRLPMVHSLKEKRSIIKSLRERVKNRFNVAVAEIEDNELWQSAVLGFVTIANRKSRVDSLLSRIINFIEDFNGIMLLEHTFEYF